MKEDSLAAMNAGRMTSLEIAELTGKQHKNLMQALRKMEPAWEKVQGLKFQLSSRVYNLPNGGTKVVPYYSLTTTECLYIATKFNDEARVANNFYLPTTGGDEAGTWGAEGNEFVLINRYVVFCQWVSTVLDKKQSSNDCHLKNAIKREQ